MKNDSKKGIFKHFLNVGIGTIISTAIGIIATPIITRIVDPIEYGKFNMMVYRVGVAASFLYFGLNESLFRFFFTYNTDEEKCSLLKLCFLPPLVASILLTITLVVLNLLKISFFDYSLFVTILFCIYTISMVWNTLSLEMLQNTKNSSRYTVAIVSQKMIYSIISIVCVFINPQNAFYVFIIATIISSFVSAIIATSSVKKYWFFKGVKLPSNTIEIIKYSIPIYIYFVIYSYYDVFDKFLVEKYFSDADIGIYSAIFGLVGIFNIIQTAFYTMWKPVQTEQFSIAPDDKKVISNGNRYMSILMLFVGINAILFKDVICLFVGKAYRTGSNLIPFLIFNPIINTLIPTVTSGIEYSKKSYLRIFIILITLVLDAILTMLLIPSLGLIGIGVGLALSLICQYLLTLCISNRYYHIDYGISKFLIIVTLVFAYACIITYCSSILVSIICYIVCLSVLFVIYLDDIKDMFAFFVAELSQK